MTNELQETLDQIRADFESKAPREALELMHEETQRLIDSGRHLQAVQAGDHMPAFELLDTDGSSVRSTEYWERGPLVISFFRGFW